MRRCLIGFAVLIAIATTAHFVHAAVDLSSPKSTAKSFFEALNNADSAAMRDCMVVDGDDQQKLSTAFIDVIVAGKKLADAAKSKFGQSPQAEKLAAGALGREDVAAIDAAEQTEVRDEASLKLRPESRPMKFRKTPGGWKLIVIDYAGAKSDEIPDQIKLLASLATAMNETTEEINAERFPTIDDAESAIRQRLSDAMVKRYKPATTQASP